MSEYDRGSARGDSPPRRRLEAVWSVGRWAILLAALGYLWHSGALSYENLRLSKRGWLAIPAAVFFIAVSTMAIGVRFHFLLRSLACPTRLKRQCGTHLSGLLLQQVGSDAAFDVLRTLSAKAAGGGMADILAAIVLDRLLGLAALTVVTGLGLAAYWSGGGLLGPAAAFLAVAGAAAMLFLAAPAVGWLERREWFLKIPGAIFLVSVGKSLGRFRRHGGRLAGLFMVSLFVHSSMFAALYCCGNALADAKVSPGEAWVGYGVATLTGGIPLPMAGLGVGEAAFGETVVQMRGMGESGRFASIFLLTRMLTIMLGAAAWLWESAFRSGGRFDKMKTP